MSSEPAPALAAAIGRVAAAVAAGGGPGYRPTARGLWAPADCAEVGELFARLRLGGCRRFLDLGSGDGRVVMLASLFTRAEGVEIDRALCARARAISAALGLKRASFAEGDCRRVALAGYDFLFAYPDQPLAWLAGRLPADCGGRLVVYGAKFAPPGMNRRATLRVGRSNCALWAVPGLRPPAPPGQPAPPSAAVAPICYWLGVLAGIRRRATIPPASEVAMPNPGPALPVDALAPGRRRGLPFPGPRPSTPRPGKPSSTWATPTTPTVTRGAVFPGTLSRGLRPTRAPSRPLHAGAGGSGSVGLPGAGGAAMSRARAPPPPLPTAEGGPGLQPSSGARRRSGQAKAGPVGAPASAAGYTPPHRGPPAAAPPSPCPRRPPPPGETCPRRRAHPAQRRPGHATAHPGNRPPCSGQGHP